MMMRNGACTHGHLVLVLGVHGPRHKSCEEDRRNTVRWEAAESRAHAAWRMTRWQKLARHCAVRSPVGLWSLVISLQS